MDYHNVAQGKITIPNVDDGEECTLTDVRLFQNWQKNLFVIAPSKKNTALTLKISKNSVKEIPPSFNV